MSEEFTNFRAKIGKDQRTILDNIYNKNFEECKKAIKDSIERDKHHTTIVNMCAFAFSEYGPFAMTGYHFITVEPLYKYRGEQGSKIFDLIIYNKEFSRAILIECKSSIGDPRSSVLNPLRDQIDTVIKHKIDLEEEVGGEIADLEYVICGVPQDVEEVRKFMKDDEPVCLWTIDLFSFTLKLYNPSGLDAQETGKLVKKRQLHIDEKLRRKLYEKTESRGQIEGINVLPTSHICRILSRVFVRIIQKILLNSTEQEKRFWLHELVDMAQEELPKVSSDDVRRISNELYDLAARIKIVEQESTLQESTLKISPSQDISFRLKINAKSPRTIEASIEDKYIEEICKERSPRKSLNEFKEYLRNSSSSLDYHFSKANEDYSI